MESLFRNDNDVEIVALTSLEETARMICLLEEIALAEGWQPDESIRNGVQNSVYFGICISEELVGGLQLARMTAGGTLACHAVWPELIDRTRPTDAHVGLFLVSKKVRGKNSLFWLLCSEVWRYCFRQGIEQLWLEATPATLKCYRHLGWPLKIVGPARPYCGEECLPCTVRIGDVASAMSHRAKSSARLVDLIFHTLRGHRDARPDCLRAHSELTKRE